MIKQNLDHIKGVLARADLLKSPQQVQLAVENMAAAIRDIFIDKDPLVLCVMNGSLIPSAMILSKLDFPLRVSYLHATRYQSSTTGGELEWFARPRWPLFNEHVLIIDDIFDAGTTLELVVQYCQQEGASSVRSAVLVEKLRVRSCMYRPDFIGLTIEDRYVFGVGMDYKEYLRNLPGIYAVAEVDL